MERGEVKEGIPPEVRRHLDGYVFRLSWHTRVRWTVIGTFTHQWGKYPVYHAVIRDEFGEIKYLSRAAFGSYWTTKENNANANANANADNPNRL